MKISLTSVLVDDQQKALEFYTQKLGFTKRFDLPMGEARWLTVVSADNPAGTELLLEPDWNPVLKGAAKDFKKTLVDNHIPYTAFQVDDLQKEYDRLKTAGVVFTQAPTGTGKTKQAVFDDTCGNLIQIYQIN